MWCAVLAFFRRLIIVFFPSTFFSSTFILPVKIYIRMYQFPRFNYLGNCDTYGRFFWQFLCKMESVNVTPNHRRRGNKTRSKPSIWLEHVWSVCSWGRHWGLSEQRPMGKLQHSTDHWCNFITHSLSKSETDFHVVRNGPALLQSRKKQLIGNCKSKTVRRNVCVFIYLFDFSHKWRYKLHATIKINICNYKKVQFTVAD